MTRHQINSLVGDLVAMAQAMERLPQVEAQVESQRNTIMAMENEIGSVRSDLEQAKSYAATLEAKVHNAEVARDDAELRFLEADEQRTHTLDRLNQMGNIIRAVTNELDPPKPQPEPLPEPMPVTIEPSGYEHDPVPSLEGTPMPQPSQGQSEPGPIAQEVSSVTGDSAQSPIAPLENASPSATTEHSSASPSPSGPYHSLRYIDYPGYVRRDDWLAGGGTEEDYDWREGDPTPAIHPYSGSF